MALLTLGIILLIGIFGWAIHYVLSSGKKQKIMQDTINKLDQNETNWN